MSTLGRCLRNLGITAGFLLSVSIATTPSSATPITFNFTGDVTKVQGLANPPFSVSTGTMSGFMTVDTTNNGTSGHYNISNFSVNIEGQIYTRVGPPSFFGVEIVNGTPGPDQFKVSVIDPIGPSFVVNPGLTLVASEFKIDLKTDDSTSAFGSVALPPTIPSISSFANTNQWSLAFHGDEGHKVSGTITALTAVPLPASLLLFGAGLVALIGLGAGNWRKWNSGFA